MEEKHLKGSGLRYLRIQSKDIKLSKLNNIDVTSYVELIINHMSLENIKKR